MERTRHSNAWLACVAACLTALFLLLPAEPAFAEGIEVNHGLPVVYVTVNGSRDDIAAMNESEVHSVICDGTIRIEVPGEFHYSDSPDQVCKSSPELVCVDKFIYRL